MIKYKIKHKIVNCEKIESVTSHDLYPPPPVTNCHTFSDPLPPWSVTYFMDGPYDDPACWSIDQVALSLWLRH